VGDLPRPPSAPVAVIGRKFLRGYQVTDADGMSPPVQDRSSQGAGDPADRDEVAGDSTCGSLTGVTRP